MLSRILVTGVATLQSICQDNCCTRKWTHVWFCLRLVLTGQDGHTHTQDIHAAIDLTCWVAFFDGEAHQGWHFGKQQHDCEEALQRIVIDAECRRDKAGTMLTQCLQSAMGLTLRHTISSVYHCGHLHPVHEDHESHELVAQIIVPQNADPIFLLTLIDQNTAAENIEVFWEPCPECRMCAESNKTTGIINATHVMIISLNRGHGHRICDGHRTERFYESKCLTPIIPDPVLHLGSKTFGLRSVVTRPEKAPAKQDQQHSSESSKLSSKDAKAAAEQQEQQRCKSSSKEGKAAAEQQKHK